MKAKDLRTKFKECEKHAKQLYNARHHQFDTTGALDKGDISLYYEAFKHYFD